MGSLQKTSRSPSLILPVAPCTAGIIVEISAETNGINIVGTSEHPQSIANQDGWFDLEIRVALSRAVVLPAEPGVSPAPAGGRLRAPLCKLLMLRQPHPESDQSYRRCGHS